MQDSSSDSSIPPSIKTKGFWTPGRIVLSLIGVALISALGLSSCNSTERNTNQPGAGVARSGSPANASSPASPSNNPPPNNPPPAAFVSLPQQVRDYQPPTPPLPSAGQPGSLSHNREVLERNVIQRALANNGYSRSRAASALGIRLTSSRAA